MTLFRFLRPLVSTALSLCLLALPTLGCTGDGGQTRDDSAGHEALILNQASTFSCTDTAGNRVMTSGGSLYNGTLPSYVTATPVLTTTEMSVSKAYLTLFGRAPDLGGLNYWSSQLGANATVVQAINLIQSAMSGALLAPVRLDGPEYVEYVYANALGKSVEDDRCGIKFWTEQLAATHDRAALVGSILDAAASTTEPYSHNMFSNRMLAVEAASRLQKARNRSLDYQDSQTLIRRITDSLSSYTNAMDDLDRLTQGIASSANQWDQDYTPATVDAQALPLNNTSVNNLSVKEHKSLVWYNRQGQMLFAHVFLPPGYSAGSNYPAIISVHGGAWREGFIEKLQKYNAAIARAGYVVFAPAYRLTAIGYASPAMQNDVEDFINLVKSSGSRFKINVTRVGLFGESAGGHLVNLLGSKSNMRCVSTLYPVSDLSDPSVYKPNDSGVVLTPFVQAYAGSDPATQRAVSPTHALTAAGTRFHIQHGTADTLVPYSQTTSFANAASALGVTVAVRSIPNTGHGFYDAYAPDADLTQFNNAVDSLRTFFSNCL